MENSDKPSRLERMLAKIAGAVIGAEYFLCYHNFDDLHISTANAHDRFRWLPIENSYFGDVPEIFCAIMLSEVAGNKIRQYGAKRNNSFTEGLGRNFSKLAAAGIGAYYTLGETVIPQLLPGSADAKDVPAVILTSIATPIIASYASKRWKTLKEKILSLIN